MIMKLSVDLIPHKKFHKGLWLQSDVSPWYFFYETPREYSLPTSNKFYKTVDKDLLDIVKLFHAKGIPTTPSCSGHIMSKQHYSDLYDTIVSAKNNIQTDGIKLKNPETNRRFFYKNKNYTLPWNKEGFLNNMEDYQKKGVIGFVDSINLYDKIKNTIPSIHDEGVTMVFSKGNTKNDINKNWTSIGKLIKKHIYK